MRIAVVGAGSIGCLIAARLSASPANEVILVARRAGVVADIRRNGIRMISPKGRSSRHPVEVTDDTLSVGVCDLVILCVKAYSLRGVVSALAPLVGPSTVVVPMVNGIPWWYPHAQPAPLAGYRLKSVDPDGVLSSSLHPDRILGALAYVAVETDQPGRIRHINDQRFVFGDPASRDVPVVHEVVAAFNAVGFDTRASDDIRAEIWVKLWGNLAFNPISVLTLAPLDRLCADPGTNAVARAMMEEANQVARRLGVTFRISLDERIASAAAIGTFKTSMLQDFEAGRRLELEAIVGAVIELAEVTEVPVPTLKTILALTALRAAIRDSAP